MDTIIFISVLLSVLCFFALGVLIEKHDEGKRKSIVLEIFLGVIGLFFLGATICLSYNMGIKIGLRARLNEPIDDIRRLHGYAVLDKSYFKKKINDETSEETKYFLELGERITGFDIFFSDVEVTEEIYRQVESDKVYPSGEPADLQE